MARPAAAAAVACLLLVASEPSGGVAARSLRPAAEIGVPAQPGQPARRLPQSPVDSISVTRSGAMPAAVEVDLHVLGAALGVPSASGRSFTVGLHRVRRGAAVVQQASGSGPGVWQFPMSATALPVDALGRVMGPAVAAAVAQGGVVLSATSAGLRGAVAGDVLELVAADGTGRLLPITLVAPDGEIGGAELVMSPEHADLLGAPLVTRVLFFGQFDRARLEAELAARGYADGAGGVRISRSWAPRSPDSVLGSVQLKVLLGEFAYRVNGNGTITVDQQWVGANIVPVSFRSIPIRSSCHRTIVDPAQAALDEVAAAGLGWAIDVRNTNTYGGCYNPRYAVVSGSIGSLSRHAWGAALDMNTDTNGQGRVPRMNCDVVRIFRKHGFAWGGNFATPDGMHFEYVGERRDTLAFPSAHCPNLVTGVASAGGSPLEGDVMFAPVGGEPVVGAHG